MKWKIALAMLSVSACLSAPASAQMADSLDPSNDLASHDVPLPVDPEGKAEDLRLAGKCNEAIPILRHLVALGDGYELAQYNLGLCLFDTSKTAANAQQAASLQQEAAGLILKAANHNLPKAQASLAAMYLDGDGVARDPIAAGTWALIYRANGARLALALPNISADLQARLDGVLTDTTWAEARARADAWAPVAQNPR
jgi:hypothetical protein